MSDSTNSFIISGGHGVAVFENPCSKVKFYFVMCKLATFNHTCWLLYNHGTQFFLGLLMVFLLVKKFPA